MAVTMRDRAISALRDLTELSDDDGRILCGPFTDPGEVDDTPDIDRIMATNPESLAIDLTVGICGVDAAVARGMGRRRCFEGVAAAMASVTPETVRDDGIAVFQATSAAWPDEVEAQIAIDVTVEPRAFVGAYHNASLYVEPEYRGRGIGSDLVLAQLLGEGTLHVWSHDTPAFSPEGEAAHLSAMRKLREMAAPETGSEISP